MPAATPSAAPEAAPTVRRVAEVSLDAIRENLARLGGPGITADLRADAYGHGLATVAPVLAEAGVRSFLVSPEADEAVLDDLRRTFGEGDDGSNAEAVTIAVGDDTLGDMGSDAAERSVAEGNSTLLGPELFGLTDRSLRPALRLVAEVLGVKALRAGEGVSYGYSYRPDRDTTLALIGIGYAHGAVRRASNRASVFVGGAQHPIAGAISMDQFSVDLEGGQARVGDDAVLFGDPARGEPHVLDWAEATGIPAAAITSRLAHTVARVVIDGESPDAVVSSPAPAPVREAVASRTVARISLDAFGHNVSTLAATVAPSATMLVVKSDAYGHGLMPCVRTALDAGASWLGALEIGAGLRLRDEGVTVPLFAWMHGTRADFRGAIERDIDLGVSAAWQLDAIAAAGEAADRGVAQVHLKIDTGLRRSGANPEQWPALVERALDLQRDGKLRLRAAWTHLSDTSPDEDRRSIGRFNAAVDEARALGAEFELLHLGASSAGIDFPEARFDLVRFGIAAFGISPFHDRSGRDLGLVPVMTLAARVLAVRDGIAAIAAGYGDGVQCLRGSSTSVLIGGKRAPLLDIGPDVSHVDVSALDAAVVEAIRPGVDEAIIFGPGDAGEPTAEAWAEWSDTVGDELVTGVTARVPRAFR